MLTGEKSVRRLQVSTFLLVSSANECGGGTRRIIDLSFFLLVKYFSPATNLCVIRVARGPATSTAWAALVMLDRVGTGAGSGEGRKVIPHVIHVSGTPPFVSFSLLDGDVTPGCRGVGTLKHAQIAAVEWNREAIGRVKAGVNVYGLFRLSPSYLPLAGVDKFHWAHAGVATQHENSNSFITHLETSMQEIEKLQD